MKISIETKVLQDLTSKAIKGSGRNSLIPFTLGINIEVVGTDLILTTTDNVNTLKVIGKDTCSAQSSGFFTCVDSDTFSRLVAKTTSKIITLENTETALKVKGNGEYSLEVMADKYNNNEIARIPELPFDDAVAVSGELDLKVLADVLNYNKLNISKTADAGQVYTGYYVDKESVVTYNGAATITMSKLITGADFSPMVLPYNLVELMSIIPGNTATIKCESNKIKVVSDDIEIVGALLNNAVENEDGTTQSLFRADKLKEFTNVVGVSSCVVSKSEILDVLDRLSIFVTSAFGVEEGIKLAFGSDKVIISNIDKDGNSTNVEALDYKSSADAVDYVKNINWRLLRLQVNACKENEIEMFYNSQKGLVINTGMIYQVLPYLVDYDASQIKVVR